MKTLDVLKRLAAAIQPGMTGDDWHTAHARFRDYCTAALVLELFAENERLETLRTIDAETIQRHQRQITALVGEGVHLKAENERLQSHIDEMTKMRETHGFESWAAVLTDAKRYRWLRVNNYYAHVQLMEADGSMSYVYADEMDISIDAAMGKEG